MAATILVVDDEPIIRDTLAEYLQQESFRVQSCGTGEAAVGLISKTRFDVVLCDINLPGLDGLEVLEYTQRVSPESFVILITAFATVDTAVEAFQAGAHDYLMKPIILRDVATKIRRLLKQRELQHENLRLRRALNHDDIEGFVVGASPAMRQALELARKAAPTTAPVLIRGENGTGKELIARMIHRDALRASQTDAPFLAVNCAAIPAEQLESQLFGNGGDDQGLIVRAEAGTLFLDEVGEMPLALQSHVLRAIEQGEVLPTGAALPVPVRARVIAATMLDLAPAANDGRFRADLYYRLNAVAVRLPPLRERREDLPELVEVIVRRQARALGKRISGVSHAAMQRLLDHPWKGNVRELENALERAAILCDGALIGVGDLPPDLAPDDSDPSAIDDLNAAVERFEKRHLERMLRLTADKREAAQRLGIGLSSLYRKIEHYGIGGNE